LFDRVQSDASALAALGIVVVSHVGLVAAALFAPLWLFAVAAAFALAVEGYLLVRASAIKDLLGSLGVDRIYRHLARDLAAVLFVVRSVDLDRAQTLAAIALPALVWGMAVASELALSTIDRRTPVSMVVRNLDLGPVARAPRPPMWMVRAAGDRLPYLNGALLAGAVVAAAADSLTPYVAGGVVAGVVALGILGGLASILWQGRRMPARDPLVDAVEQWFTTTRPEVMLCFAGPAKDVYQANMWLEPVAALDQPAVVLMRSSQAYEQLAATTLPVVCVPKAVDLMNLKFDSIRVIFYPANVGLNIHMLREPGIKHVFIGHGDSDKQASVNPYSKVYDEVWVAGPAGRERYARAGVGVLDQDIVEIGRPQLAAVRTIAARSTGRPFTILYAPTWEGWLDDPYATSLTLMGEAIVRGVLALSPPVRLVYKPHPLTGSRHRPVFEIHTRLVELIRAAGGDVDARTMDGPEHRVVTARTPSLFDCFNDSDMLISDVSSVVADYVQSQRPYVMANPANLPEDEFRHTYPTARAAYLLSRDGGELEKVVNLARSGDDPMREARRELKTYLLGPDQPSSIERFQAETTRLAALARR
jgi:hypothetical protein